MYKKSLLALADFNILTGEYDSFDFTNPKLCHGKGSGGGTTSTNTVTNSAPPPEIMAAYQQALSQAQAAASQPLQQYSGQTVAPFNSAENSAFGTINSTSGLAQPYINAATNLIDRGTQPLWSGVQQFSPEAVQQYQSPYTTNVLNAAVAQQQNTDAQQQQALKGNAISSGAWGGDRAGVASAILSGQQDLANNATNANILNTGYNTALGEFNTQQQAQLGANEANSYLAQQGAFGLGNLGQEALGTTLTGANAQLTAGQLQQQQAQAELNVPYEQFLQRQAYPFQTAQYYANIAEGLGSNSGGTGNGTGTSTSPGASLASQVAGGALGTAGLFGLGGGFSGAAGWGLGPLLFAKRGGRIKGYESGGSVQDEIPNLSISYIPTSSTTHGSGPPKPADPTPKIQPPEDPMAQGENVLLGALTSGALKGVAPPGSSAGPFGQTNLSDSAPMDALTGNSQATQNLINSNFLFPGNVGSQFGVNFKCGGMVKGYDDGGLVGGEAPITDSTQGQQQPTVSSSLNDRTPEQLQQIVMRLPAGSPQARTAQAILQQKRMLPNVGAQAQGGFNPSMQIPSYTGMARGGRMHFDDGGDVPDPLTPDAIQRQLEAQSEISQEATGGMGGSRQMVASAEPPESALPYVAPHASAAPTESSTSHHREVNPWLALATAGFATAAGQSPYAMQNLGRGALAGLSNYGQQQKEADTVNDATDKLMQEAKWHKDQIAIEQQRADQQKEYQTGDLEIKRGQLRQKELVKDAFGHPTGVFDPTTMSIIPLKGTAVGLNTQPVTGGNTPSVATNSAAVQTVPPTSILPPDAQERLQQVATDPQDQALILGIIQGRIPPSRMALGKEPEAYIKAASYVDGGFDFTNPLARSKTATAYAPGGQQGNMITSLDTASRHAAATALAGLDLNNTSGVPLVTPTINSLANSYEQRQGDPRLGNFQSYLGNYGHEAIKVISGKTNPGEAETAEFVKPIDSSGSPEQILGAISAKNGMMLSRAEEMQNDYNKQMGHYGQKKQVVSPAAAQAFQDMDMLYVAAKNGSLDSPQAQAARQRLETYAKPVKTRSAQPAPAASPVTSVPPPPEAIQMLKQNPALAPAFEQKYGVPASQFMGGQ